jgi:hypothetical protein
MVKVSINDNSDKLIKALEGFKNLQVYVGVPEENSSREIKKSEGINNAELAFILTNGVRQLPMRKEMESDVEKHGYHAAYDMYLQSHGSPLWQIPPRPIIQPAIEDDKEEISELLKKAMQAFLDGDYNKGMEYLNKAGLEGQAASQDWFTNPKNGWPPNAKSTIEGWDSPWGQHFDGKGSNRPNIDTGELRKAITYVVKEG